MDHISPIILDFLTAKESLGVVLQKYCNEEQALESAFLRLAKESEAKEVSQGFLNAIDKAIMEGHPDANLFVFFICQVSNYYHKHHQIEKAKALLLIAESVTDKGILPFIKAVYFNHLAIHKRYLGEIAECEAYMSKSISLVEKSEPRAKVLIQNYMTNMAFNGKLKENGEYKLEDLNGLPSAVLLTIASQVKIINCIITGNYIEGIDLIQKVKEMNQSEVDTSLKTYGELLKIYSGDFDEANFMVNDGKLMASAFHHFSNERYDEAMKICELLKDKFEITNMNFSFGYLPLHFQLCLKKSGPAKLLLQEKIKKGGGFYIDDLFFGRIRLLENDEEGANESFMRLIENVTRYGAMKRLEFELQFAKEMKLPVILRLLNGWKEDGSALVKKKKAEKIQKVINDEKGIKRLIGNSTAINQVKELVVKYAVLKSPVLITGETGTGKELVSRALHDEGPYPNEPFLAINCGALTDNLLQSELFGYEAGSFTGALKQRKGIFEAAGKGTVFLDEFEDVSTKMQSSLLRVLETSEIRMIGGTKSRKINCKIVVATNIELKSLVGKKLFREDLYFRLSRFEIKLPALRERKNDIPNLIERFLLPDKAGELAPAIDFKLLEVLSDYSWPGNIRELRNAVERMKILHSNKNVYGIEEFDFDQLENFSKPTIDKAEVFNDGEEKSQLVHSASSKEENDRIQSILKSGFKIQSRIDSLKSLFKQHKKLSRSQVSAILKVSPLTAANALQTLCEDGFIEKVMPSKSTKSHYFNWKE